MVAVLRREGISAEGHATAPKFRGPLGAESEESRR
jgi:hypothetical protein